MLRIIVGSVVIASFLAIAIAKDRDTSAAGAAAGRDQQNSDRQNSSANQAADAAQPAGDREEAAQDPTQAFIKDACNDNLFEIQAGQIAVQKAQDDQIKQFAQMLIKDHTQANQQLKQIAQSANVQLEEKLDAVHQAKLQKMQKCPASEFTRKYVFDQAAGHTNDVLEFQYQSQNAQNPQVKQFATQILPKLQQHLKHANDLAMQQVGGATGGEARPAGARIEGNRSDRGGASDRTGTSGAAGSTDRDSNRK